MTVLILGGLVLLGMMFILVWFALRIQGDNARALRDLQDLREREHSIYLHALQACLETTTKASSLAVAAQIAKADPLAAGRNFVSTVIPEMLLQETEKAAPKPDPDDEEEPGEPVPTLSFNSPPPNYKEVLSNDELFGDLPQQEPVNAQ